MRLSSWLIVVPLLAASACSSTSASPAPDDASASDASDDAPNRLDGGGAGPVTCRAPLSESADFDTAPIATWCAKGNGGGNRSTNACGGYYIVIVGEGADCDTQYLFDATTKKLVAKVHQCNVAAGVCVEGPATITPPSEECIEHGFTFQYDVCPNEDASTDSSSDAPSE